MENIKSKKNITYKENTKSRNGIFKNILVVWRDAIVNYDPKVILYSLLEVITTVTSLFMTMALPSFAVKMLTNGYSILNTFLYIGIYTTALMLINLLLQRMKINNEELHFLQRVLNGMVVDLKIISTDYQNIDNSNASDMLSKATAATYTNDDVGFPAIIIGSRNITINVIALLIYSFIASSLNPFLVLLLIAAPIINIVANNKKIKWVESHKDEWAKYDSKLRYLKNESLKQKNGKDIRLYKIQTWFVDLFRNVLDMKMYWKNKELRMQFTIELIGRLVTLIQNVFVYGYLLIQIKNGMPIDMFVLYLGVVSGIGGFIKLIFDNYANLSINNVYINDYYDFVNMADKTNREPSSVSINDESCAINIDNISYKYYKSSSDIFTNLNLKIKKGEKIAIVGENGAGKSTLIKIICGLYQPDSGNVYLNDIESNRFNLNDYFNQFSVVFQEADVFALTIAQNVACSTVDGIDRERVCECLKLAGLMDKVNELKNGIDTALTKELDDDGILLSGGETQKLMLARALYKDSKVIILDEPTAALDPIAESEMYEKYSNLTNGKTSIFISHRLSSTKFCDRILFMRKGQIIESGTHDELLALGGAYANMYEIQSHYYQKNLSEVDGGILDEEAI